MPKSRVSAAFYLVLVFLSGILVGAVSHRLYMTRTVSAPPRNPEEWRKRYVGEMRDQLKLDEAQIASLQKVLDETRQRFHQMREQEKPAADAIQNDQIAKIRAFLRPEQQPAYDRFRAERERRRQEAERRKGGPDR